MSNEIAIVESDLSDLDFEILSSDESFYMQVACGCSSSSSCSCTSTSSTCIAA